MLILFLMNFMVGLTAYFITYRLLRFRNFLDSIFAFSLLFFSQIIVTELILGIAKTLYLHDVIFLNLAVLLSVWTIVSQRKSSFSFKNTKAAIIELIKNKIVLFALTVIFVFGFVKVFINLVNPPFGWDSLNYHFTFAVEWLRHANLDTPITVFDDPSPSFYPINGSLLFLWLALPLRNVFLADLGQLPFFILALLAAYGIARKIGLKNEISFYALTLFTLIPNFFKQLQITYVDVMVAALFLICVNFLFSLNQEFSRRNVFIFSLGLGLLLGTKTTALPYSILLIIPFFYICCSNLSRFYLILSVIPVILALGGFSYIRNFFHTGNPLYPLDFKLLGRAIFSGVMDMNTYRAHFRIQDYRISKLLFHEGLGLQTLLFVLPSIVLSLPLAIIKRRKDLNFNLAYFLILPLLLYLVYRYIIPLANVRYLYSLLAVGIISGLYLADILKIPKKILSTIVTICILASMPELAKRQELIVSMMLTFLVFFSIPLLSKPFVKLKEKLNLQNVLIPLIIILVSSLALLEHWYTRNEFPRYLKMVKYSGFWPQAAKAWDWLNRNTTGNNIAYAGRPVPFPLYGANFKNNVYYVSVNKTDPAKLYNFAHSRYEWGYDFMSLHKNLEAEGNYRSAANYTVWLENLLRRKTDYLFIYSLHQTKDIEFPIEEEWAEAHPVRFRPVFSEETIRIYKIAK